MKKKIDKTKFKDILFKIIHGVSYFCTFGFIAMILIVAFQGCSSHKNKRSDSIKSNEVSLRADSKPLKVQYQYRDIDLSTKAKYEINKTYFVSNPSYYFYQNPNVAPTGTKYVSLYGSSGFYALGKDNTAKLLSLFFQYVVYDDDGQYVSYINNAFFRELNEDGSTLRDYQIFTQWGGNNPTWNLVQNGLDFTILYSDDFSFPTTNSFGLDGNKCLTPLTNNYYTFNFLENFNPNAPLGIAYSPIFESANFDGNTEDDYYLVWNREISVKFLCNDLYFDTIQFWYYMPRTQVDENTFYYLDEYGSPHNYYTIFASNRISYAAEITFRNKSLDNSHPLTAWTRKNTNVIYNNKLIWALNYRGEFVLNTYSHLEILDVDDSNKAKLASLNISGGYTDDGFSNNNSDLFSLLSMAFNSVLPILNIAILPGFTIGFLIFAPLAVSIVLFVVWLVKR